jgi:hypothetical protein
LVAQVAPGYAFLRSGSGNVMFPPTIVKKLGLSNLITGFAWAIP